jgi:hypothetical protein
LKHHNALAYPKAFVFGAGAMADLNPYAPPPLIAEAVLPAQFGLPQGLWRQDNVLVMQIGAPLPPKCVKSNQPTERFLKRSLTWYPPWLGLTILIATPLFVLLVLILQKKATIFIGLTPEWRTRRLQRMAIAWGLVLLGVGLFFCGILLLNATDVIATLGGWLMGLSPLTILGGIIYGNYACRMVYAKRIDDRFIWLKGVCPEYLAVLPAWPGPR